MDTSTQQCARLLVALEDLVQQETLLIEAEDYREIERVQELTAPLVERLTLLASAADAGTRQLASAVISRRNENLERMAGHISRTDTDLQRGELARSRVLQVAPMYRAPAAGDVAGHLRAKS